MKELRIGRAYATCMSRTLLNRETVRRDGVKNPILPISKDFAVYYRLKRRKQAKEIKVL